VSRLTPYANNARTHTNKQIRQIAKSIERFGFTNPVLIDDDDQIIGRDGSTCGKTGNGRSEPAAAISCSTSASVRYSRARLSIFGRRRADYCWQLGR
jgi:hypothetical protein